jgi:hypothetical protein
MYTFDMMEIESRGRNSKIMGDGCDHMNEACSVERKKAL